MTNQQKMNNNLVQKNKAKLHPSRLHASKMKPELVLGGGGCLRLSSFLILAELAAATVNLRESRIRDVGWLKNTGVGATQSFYFVLQCRYISFLPSQKFFFSLVDMFKRAVSSSKPEQMLLIFA